MCPINRPAAAAIAPRSAPTLIVLATTSARTPMDTTGVGKRRCRLAPSPALVCRPIRAHISWTAVMSGKVNSAVQSRPKPNWLPTWEYVPMPDGSSSLAPVMNPGPRSRRMPSGPRRTTSSIDFGPATGDVPVRNSPSLFRSRSLGGSALVTPGVAMRMGSPLRPATRGRGTALVTCRAPRAPRASSGLRASDRIHSRWPPTGQGP